MPSPKSPGYSPIPTDNDETYFEGVPVATPAPDHPKGDPGRYTQTEARERKKPDGTGKLVVYARTQIFENPYGAKLALPVDPKTGRPLGEIVAIIE